MGSLVSETPLSEITATLERLAYYGVGREDLRRFRSGSGALTHAVVDILKHGEKALTFGRHYRHIIDGDAEPHVPKGLRVVAHRRCGKWRWHPDAVSLFWTESQKKESARDLVSYDLFQKELQGVSVLNANVLWYLYERQWLIPPNWSNYIVFFWGTVYRESKEDFVYALQWAPHSGENNGSYRLLKEPFKKLTLGRSEPAAIRAQRKRIQD